MCTFLTGLRRGVAGAAYLSIIVSTVNAQNISDAGAKFTTFTVPGATSLSVESINNAGTVSGYYGDASNDTIAFLRTSSGTITSYTEPADTTSPSATIAGQINNNGLVAGEFFDTAAATYEGYIYNSNALTYKTYQVPGEPQYTSTGLVGINDKGNLCGSVFPPPYTTTTAFVEIGGTVSMFSVDGSTTNACYGINDSATAVGYYADAAGVFHGWMRTQSGTITTINVPAAATTTGTAPCISVAVGGTVPLGINAAGYVSGHYWDTSYNEHGFLMTPSGTFFTLNVPGAFQTSGGGLNNKAVVVGHYQDSSCNSSGYIFTP